MARVLLSGYYGFGNVGDEAILASTVESLRAMNPSLEISVLSANPEETARVYDVVTYDRMSPRLIIKAIVESDLVVFGGGSLLQDDSSFRSLLYYLSIIFGARILGRPAVVYANGIGPIHSWVGRMLTRLALSTVKRVTVRDPESERLLKRIGVTKPVRVTADPAFLLSPCSPERRDEILRKAGVDGDDPIVWLALRPGKAPDNFYLSFVPAIQYLRSKGYHPCLLVMQEQDKSLAPVINEALSKKGLEAAPYVSGTTPRETLALLQKSAFCLGMRLHTLILAARAGVPFIGVEIDPKLGAFCRATGCPVMPDPAESENADLVLEFERFVDIKDCLQKGLEEKLPVFTALAADNIDMVFAALRNAGDAGRSL